jgi:hypothetical protein
MLLLKEAGDFLFNRCKGRMAMAMRTRAARDCSGRQ